MDNTLTQILASLYAKDAENLALRERIAVLESTVAEAEAQKGAPPDAAAA